MRTWLLPLVLGGVFLYAATVRAGGEGIVYPANAGVLNVRDAPYGAKGDGKTDDTAAIQRALSEGLGQHRVVYLPNGVYLVSDTLRWRKADPSSHVGGWGLFLQLQGQSRAGTIILLAERAPGFGDPAHPKAVIQTGSSGSDGNKAYHDGEGNEAFENHLRDFTVEVGAGHAGAVGIDWQASNVGAIRHVAIRADPGADGGCCGISLTRRDNGPALIKDVQVTGFRFGLRFEQEITQFTLEDLQLFEQRECGIWCRDAVLAAQGILSRGPAPAVRLTGGAMLILLDSSLSGGVGGMADIPGSAIECEAASRVLLRNVSADHYAGGLVAREGKRLELPAKVAAWCSDPAAGPAAGAAGAEERGSSLVEWRPARDELSYGSPEYWADAGAPSGRDDTAAIQAALDQHKQNVYLRHGVYRVSAPLRVPYYVTRIQGIGASVETIGRLPGEQAVFRFAEKDLHGGTTILDRLSVGAHGGWLVEHADARELVLNDIITFDAQVYRGQPGAGTLFIEDVSGAGYRFAPGAKVWARAWNCEGSGSPKIDNDGGAVWALGWKTEGGDTVAVNRGGGKMLMLGGLAYSFGVDPQTPVFDNRDASLVTAFCGTTYAGPKGFYSLLVRDQRGGKENRFTREQTPGRGGGASVPLYLSLPPP